jgi:hypothetical protein
MTFKKLSILFFMVFFITKSEGQSFSTKLNTEYKSNIREDNRFFNMGDTLFLMITFGSCKNRFGVLYQTVHALPVQTPSKPSFLKVHGNITYNFSYRSYIDTPFAQSNLQQHLVQTNLNFVIKDKYPVQMYITNRSSNSPYFKNMTDVTVNFNRNSLLDNIKKEIKEKITSTITSPELSDMEKTFTGRRLEAQKLQSWIKSPARAQEFIEARERALNSSGTPDTSTDFLNNYGQTKQDQSPSQNLFWENLFGKELQGRKEAPLNDSALATRYESKKKKLADLLVKIKKDENQIMILKKHISDSVNSINSKIASLHNSADLFSFMKENGISKNELTKAQRLLLSVNQVGIGRSWLNYSELTIKNVSLTGLNVEMNPAPFYVAFAAGKVNYLFRDFVFKKGDHAPDQSVEIIRAGMGQKEKTHCIISFYNGRKSILNYTPSNTDQALQKVLGVSIEGQFALNPNNYVVAEIAKSSFNNAGAIPSQGDLIKKALDLKIHSNEAYSLKLFSQYPQTDTRIKAYYRKTGENFQSFNLFPLNMNQEAWMAEVNQDFLKKRLTVDAAIRKNDFISPIAAPSLSSSAVFKSLQVTLRIPKYPFISFGYYPTSQLSLSNSNVLTENLYNTMNAIGSYSYVWKGTGMNTNAVFTRFYNKGSDTGFIYFNATTFTINQSAFLGKLTLLSSGSLSTETNFHLFSFEQQAGYQFKSALSLSASIKWNRLNNAQTLIGASGMLNINIQKFGMVQFKYEKTYLPGPNRTLMPVDLGQINFFRVF